MKDQVTRLIVLDDKSEVWNVTTKVLRKVPPIFFMAADTDIKLTLTPKQSIKLSHIQTLTTIGPRLVSLVTTKAGFNMNKISPDAVTNICRLKTLGFGLGCTSGHLNTLLLQNSKTVQVVSLDRIPRLRSIARKELNCKFDKLTKLNVTFCFTTGTKAEEDWSGFVVLVNNSPNITDLSISEVAVSKEAIARHPQILLDKVESLNVDIHRNYTAGCVNVLEACRNNLKNLKITQQCPVSPEFWNGSWFPPRVLTVEVNRFAWYQHIKTHFDKSVQIKII